MKISSTALFQILFHMQVRQVVARWLAMYPTITLVLWWEESILFGKVPTYIITLIATLIAVPAVHYVVQPLVISIIHPWCEMPRLKGAMRHRMAVILWCSTYPVITLILYALQPWLQGRLPLPALTFCITVIAVPAISCLVLPRVLTVAGSWICRRT